ncbi:MAG: hypothetical protein ACK413_01200 [Patescibacteria group bacterium]
MKKNLLETIKKINKLLNGDPPWEWGLLKKLQDPTISPKKKEEIIKKIEEALKGVKEEVLKELEEIKIPLRMGVGFLYGKESKYKYMWREGEVEKIKIERKEGELILEIDLKGVSSPILKGPIERFTTLLLKEDVI